MPIKRTFHDVVRADGYDGHDSQLSDAMYLDDDAADTTDNGDYTSPQHSQHPTSIRHLACAKNDSISSHRVHLASVPISHEPWTSTIPAIGGVLLSPNLMSPNDMLLTRSDNVTINQCTKKATKTKYVSESDTPTELPVRLHHNSDSDLDIDENEEHSKDGM
ncbi:hypothetical protein FPV67DRAFT_1682598 [Lyophyllum atratum]|nr:hypothetical protein FPV67DRAFT_1682598 [Lyophyllum atratum]